MENRDQPGLTEAAQRALNMHLNDESDRLITLAKLKKAERGESGLVGVSDLLDVLPAERYSSGDKMMFDHLLIRQQERRSRLSRVLSLYGIIGVVVAIAGVAYALIAQYGARLDPGTTIGLAAAASGLAVSLSSYYAGSQLRLRGSRAVMRGSERLHSRALEDDITAKSDFIDEWSALEFTLNERAREFLKVDQFGFIDTTAALLSENIISPEDFDVIKRGLVIRNSLVHNYDAQYSATALHVAANDLRYLRYKLSPSTGRSLHEQFPY